MSSELNRRGLARAAAGLAIWLSGVGSARAERAPYVYDPKSRADPYAVRTGFTAFQLKLVGVGGISEAAAPEIDMMTPAAAASLRLSRLPTAEADTLWGQFFRGAQILLGHLESETPVVGYYNPVLDVWWLTLWEARGKLRRITAAKIVPGGALASVRPSAIDPRPAWTRRLGLRTAIQELRVAAVAPGQQFAAAFPLDNAGSPKLFERLTSSSADRDLLVSRSLSATDGVSKFAADAPALAAYADVMEALNAPRPPAAAANLAPTASSNYTTVAGVPLSIRGQMQPLAAFATANGWYVISAGPESGRFLLLSMIPKGARSVAQLALVDTQGGAV